MKLYRSKWSLIVLSTLALHVSCATKPAKPFDQGEANPAEELSTLSADFTEEHIGLIATDMVSVMMQVSELNPLTTTMQYSKPTDQFGELLVDKLRLAGYGMQEVTVDQGVNYIDYKTRSVEADSGLNADVVVGVAGLQMRREYNMLEGHVVPASFMNITGGLATDNIILNENIFLQQSESIGFESGVKLELSDTSKLATLPRNVGAGSDIETIGDNQNAILEVRSNLLRNTSDEILKSRKKYRDVVKGLVRFQPGQMTIGRKNKAVLKQIITGFDESKDAIFITACTEVSGEPDEAERRSSRIKEELGLYGVSINLIVEKGCVQTDYPDNTVESETVVLVRSRLDANKKQITAKAPLDFPTKPLVMTIPYGAGGTTDYQARIVTMFAKESGNLGQPIQIVNKTGQSGRTGWSWFAESASVTGYDVASYSVPHFIAQSIIFETPYNIDTLEPIANWGADPAVLVVAANSPFKSVADLVRAARAKPGKLKISGAGVYVGHHIALLQLEKATEIKTDYISDKGGKVALNQILSGEVEAGFHNMSDAYRMGEQVRVLAVADLERNAIMPGVPTFKEMNLDIDDSSVNYRGLMVPKGTPSAVIDRLSEAAINMFNNETVAHRMKESGAPLRIMDRESVIAMWNERRTSLPVLLRGL